MTQSPTLYGPIAEDISAVAERLRALARGHHPLLSDAITYVFDTVGKQIRPALVLLAGKLGNYDLEALVTLAASIEVVHTATLVHDDTVDGALSRRGLATVNAVWNPKIAILLGDFLFAQSAELATELNRIPVMALLSDTVMSMSSGELRQYAASQALLVDEDDYYARIAGKTASLFAMCCQGGAIVSDQSPEQVQALRSYGINLGIAFQIADDVLDYTGDERTLGKPAGSDLRQGTVTLPLILYANTMSEGSGFWTDLHSPDAVDSIVAEVAESTAPEEALRRASEHAHAARDALRVFPPGEAHDALLDLTEYVIRRNR